MQESWVLDKNNKDWFSVLLYETKLSLKGSDRSTAWVDRRCPRQSSVVHISRSKPVRRRGYSLLTHVCIKS